MKKIYLLILLNSLFINLQAQQFNWAKREGLSAYDYGYGIANDNAGNVYVAGKYEEDANFSGTILPNQGNHDIFLAKYTSAGALTWVRTGGGVLGDYAHAMCTDGTNFVYTAGEIEGTGTIIFPGSNITLTAHGDNDIYLAKYDLDGTLLWAISEGAWKSDKALGVALDNSGNVFITGYFTDTTNFEGTQIPGAGGEDMFIAKYDANGIFLWMKHAGGPGREEGKSIQCDAAGNAYICGLLSDGAVFEGTTYHTTNTASGHYYDAYVAKYSPSGALLWLKQFGGDYDDVAWSLTLDNAGKVYVSGEFNAYATFDGYHLTTTGDADIYVTALDPANGSIQWASQAGGTLIDRARGIGCDGTNLYITGQYGSTAAFGTHNITAVDSSDIFMAKINNTGTFLWSVTVGGPADSLELLGYESGNAICAQSAGNVYATGSLLNGGTFGTTTLLPYSRTDVFITKITQGADVTPPTVVDYSPSDNSLNVAKNANLVITFGEPVQKGSGNIIIKEGGVITQTIPVSGNNVSISANVVTIDATDFTAGASVNIEMAVGVFTDMSNNNFAGISNATTWNFTVGTSTTIDITPPAIINLSPADNSVNVAKNANLVITFSEPIKKGTGNIIIKESGIATQTIPVSATNVMVSGSTVAINPADFTSGASVNIEMDAGAFKDTANNNFAGIADATTWNFTVETTVIDITPPTAIAYSPADNSTNVAKNSNLVITFSEPILKGTGNIIIKESGIATQTISVSGSNVFVSGNTVTIDAADFTSGASVNIEMAAGVFKDTANNNFAGITNSTTWNFTTSNAIAPMVNSFSPADNSVNVPKNSNLIITFNELMQKGTGNIIIKESGIATQTISVSGSNVMISGNTVTIDAADLTSGASVNIEMAAGVFMDTANNNFAGITDATMWNFTVTMPVSVVEINAYQNINIYPNPSDGIFTLEINNADDQKIEIIIFNCIGEIIDKKNIKYSSEINIDLSEHTNGIYFIEIKTNQTIFTRKIIVQ